MNKIVVLFWTSLKCSHITFDITVWWVFLEKYEHISLVSFFNIVLKSIILTVVCNLDYFGILVSTTVLYFRRYHTILTYFLV